MRALEDAVGALLGIEIHYYVRIDLLSFVELVDAVGGVDVDVKRRFYDPRYDGMGLSDPPVRGFGATVGMHHYNGYEALAYARARRGVGESDFTRAARQQEILLALRDKITSGGTLLTRVPELLDALGKLVQTDIPTDRLPYLAAAADELDPANISRMVVQKPLVRGANDPIYGSVQKPDIEAIQAAVQALLEPPEPSPGPSATP
jgi:LCP family protein required for cell wall assembly